MKKTMILIAMAVLLPTVLPGQNPVRIATDTLQCGVRQPNYYYTHWYDTTDWYLYGSGLDSIHVYNGGRDTFYYHWTPHEVLFDHASGPRSHYVYSTEQYAPRPIRIRGLWAMVSQNLGGDPEDPYYLSYYPLQDSSRLPEYLYLYVPKPDEGLPISIETSFLERVASVRWDTAQPKMMCLQKTQDPTFADAKAYCHVYEALFDTVYTLEGEFWIGASANSNTLRIMGGGHEHFPSVYVRFGECPDARMWYAPHNHTACALGPDGPWAGYESSCRYGPYGVITDGQRYVEVASNDTALGLGLYTAFYADSTVQTITAVRKRCGRFVQWGDGVTDNPRTVFVTQDTLFTAEFERLPLYEVVVQSSDETLGHAEGGSAYYEGESATLEAVAHEGGRFVSWNDGVRDNPRTIVVTQDTLFTAEFEPIPRYEVEVESNDHELGYVRGSGTYYEGEEAEIDAVAHEGNYFLMWNDSVTENPRRLVVMQDTSFTAIFWREGEPVGVREAEAVGVPFRLEPNPASGEVRIVTEGEGFEGGTLTVRDAAGREVLRKELARGTRKCVLDVSGLPSGTYFVTLTTAKGTGTQKLIIN